MYLRHDIRETLGEPSRPRPPLLAAPCRHALRSPADPGSLHSCSASARVEFCFNFRNWPLPDFPVPCSVWDVCQDLEDTTVQLNDLDSPRLAGSTAADSLQRLESLLRSILARKWLVATLTIVILGIAAAAVTRITPIYRSKSVLLIENKKNNVVSIEELYSGLNTGREFQQTQIEFIQSREVASRVIAKLDLARNRYFDPRQAKPGFLASTLQRLGIAQESKRQPTDAEVEASVLVSLKANLTVAPVKLSQLVELYYESPDSDLAAAVANAFAKEYIEADLDARFDMQESASRWLNQRLATLRAGLEKSEAALQQSRERLGLVSTPSSSMGGTVRQMDSTSERAIQARMDRAQLEQVYRQVRRGAPNRYEVPVVFNHPSVIAARTAESASARRFSEIALNRGSAHPEYVTARNELEEAKANTIAQSESVIASIAKQYEVARSTELALEKALNESRGDIQDFARKEGQVTLLEREAATNRQVFDTFLSRVKETNATADFRTPVARVVDSAVPALEPVKPRKTRIVLASGLVGFLLACLLAIALERRSMVIRSVDEIEDKLGSPLLVATPRLTTEERGRIYTDPGSATQTFFFEAIRTALTSVRLSTLDVDKPVVCFASSLPGEGKSTVAFSYAVEQARTKKTVLVEGDMRRPRLTKELGLDSASLGVVGMLGGAPLAKCLKTTNHKMLHVIPAGRTESNPLSLLLGTDLPRMLDVLKTHYDVIVIDTPPLELVSDALLLGRECTGVVFVVRAGETKIPIVQRCLRRIKDARIRTFGVVLNGHDFDRASRYYGEHSAHGKYGGLYHEQA